MYLLYSLALFFLAIAYLPIFLFQAIKTGKHYKGLKERLGYYSPATPAWLEKGKPIWIHAVSVGEVMAASTLVPLLKDRYPGLPLLISTVTETGNRVARERIPDALVIFFPLDWRCIVERCLERFRPRLFLLIETEIWPNFLHACSKKDIPVAIINGRLSRNSFRNYRLVRPFLRRVLAQISLFCVQGEEDAQRFLELGAPAERVRITGNLKFDLQDKPGYGRESWEDWFPRGSSVLIAGSTHKGEEEAVLEAFLYVEKEFPNLCLLLAPRHPERLAEVEALLARRGIVYTKRTELPFKGMQGKVILLDTVGELASLYGIGTLIFVGGSLVPRGGHNILEPALFGKPILFGPYMENFAEIASLFLSQGAALQVRNEGELADMVLALLRSPERAAALGKAAGDIMAAHRGAASRALEFIEEYL